jgi:hypothetical protein
LGFGLDSPQPESVVTLPARRLAMSTPPMIREIAFRMVVLGRKDIE